MTSNKRRDTGVFRGSPSVASPGKPKSSGYAGPRPKGTSDPAKPNPDVLGGEDSQVAPAPQGENVEYPTEALDDESDTRRPGGASENIEYPSDSAPLDGL